MTEESKTQSWWQSLPGILTATAGTITAIAGLVVALYQAGFFEHDKKESAVAGAPSATVSASHEDAKEADVQSTSPALSVSAQPPSKTTNLLAADNGGHLIVAS